MKKCSKCKVEKSLSEFGRSKNEKDGLQYRCKACNKETCKSWYKKNANSVIAKTKAKYAANPNVARNANLVRKYGITLAERNEMLEKQNGCCAICNEKLQNIKVDHCHKTNKIRELLCHNCNVLLGLAKDKVATLQNAVKYLQKHTSQHTGDLQ